VRIPIDPRFIEERARYDLRFCCEDCAHFVGEPVPRCAHGWPEEEHRLSRYSGEGCEEVVYCKEFELR
jgi:hypothetical protein